MVKNTGKRIRELRQVKNISMGTLAKRAEVSKSLISQIERGEVLPSLSTLEKISIALELPITEFFQVETTTVDDADIVVQKNKRKRISIPDSATVYDVLTPTLQHPLEFLIVEFPPSSDKTGRDIFVHEGEEYFYVLEGEFILAVNDKTYAISEGDSGCFDSSKKHLYTNQTDKKARLIIAATKPYILGQ